MGTYRKKPVEVEAWQIRRLFTEHQDSPAFLPPPLQEAYEKGHLGFVGRYPEGHLDIWTLEGTMRGGMEDWIIRGVKGELYPCKPDIFEATYESAN